jgi:hypothetical protein
MDTTREINNCINFLDLTISRESSGLDISIYRKPTATDTTINYMSNHPTEHKMTARFLTRRILTLPLQQEQRRKEWHHILHTARNNSFPTHQIVKLRNKIQKQRSQPKPPETLIPNLKWTTFTYSTPQIRKITNLFKHTNVKIAFKATNTIAQLTKPPNTTSHLSPYDKSGIYSLKYKTCQLTYAGQTSRSLRLRFQEHTRYIKQNSPQSGYTVHILQNKHEYEPVFQTMTLLKHINITSLQTPYELYYKLATHTKGALLPQQKTGDLNPLIQLITDPSQQHPT